MMKTVGWRALLMGSHAQSVVLQVTTLVRFNRCLYAQLSQQSCEAPRDYPQLPSRSSPGHQAASLGLLLALGFELLAGKHRAEQWHWLMLRPCRHWSDKQQLCIRTQPRVLNIVGVTAVEVSSPAPNHASACLDLACLVHSFCAACVELCSTAFSMFPETG